MNNPYAGLPPHQYWRQGVAEAAAADALDPVGSAHFSIAPQERIATAGSCFAQHLSGAIAAAGFTYLVTERYAAARGVADEGFGAFSARFGNIYTMRQMLQLFERAYGLFRPRDRAWRGPADAWLDPFRPRIQRDGFPDEAAVEEDRQRHLGAVRRMFETADVLMLTLGLTEHWQGADGAAFPLAPGVVSPQAEAADYRFVNASCADIVAEGDALLAQLHEVNPKLRMVMTVSPVPLIATFEPRHVLVSTVASKSILRAAIDELCRRHAWVAYFPSYEIIAAHPARGQYFMPDLREVSAEGVARVMTLFRRHYLDASATAPVGDPSPAAVTITADDLRRFADQQAVVCDEDAIVAPGTGAG